MPFLIMLFVFICVQNAKVHRSQQVVETWKIRKSKEAKEKMKKINEDKVNKQIKVWNWNL